MKNNKCTIQVDLDGLWTNLNYYSYSSKIYPDIIFESSVPRFLDLFKRYNIQATFFVIGKDLEVPEKAALVKAIHKAGHEIANHTYSHPFGMRRLSPAEKLSEIIKGEKAITKLTGKKPVGFKAPGYDINPKILKMLSEKGYLYDSSVIPTFVYPLIMKINHFFSGGIKRDHGPKLGWFFAPNKLYHPSLKSEIKKGSLKITELPCSTMPILKLPFHATFATKLGLNYFNFGYNLVKRFNLPLNYEFHALDLSDPVRDKRLSSLTSVSFEKRHSLCEKIIKKIAADYEIITSEELVRHFVQKNESRNK